MVKPKKLKLGLNKRINEGVMCANSGDPRSRDRELTHQKTIKKLATLDLKIYQFAYNSKTTKCAQLIFVDNVGAYKWFMLTDFGGARSRDQNVTGRKWAESGRF